MATTQQNRRCAQPLFHYPVQATDERRRLRAVPVERFTDRWVMVAIKNETAAQENVSDINLSRCERAVGTLWDIAEGVMAERFYALVLDASEFGAQHMHAACLHLLPQGRSPLRERFIKLVALRMAKHLLLDAYVSTAEQQKASSLTGNTPMDITLLGEDPDNRYLDQQKWTKDSLILGGKLIAEVEQLLLDLADYARSELARTKPNLAKEAISSGLPDLMHKKHWEGREIRESHIEVQRSEERQRRAEELSQVASSRAHSARKIALSRSEALLRDAFSAQKKGVDA